MNALQTIANNTSSGPLYEAGVAQPFLGGVAWVKLIANYPPQFHPTPHDQWGARAHLFDEPHQGVPQFGGHYPPWLPVELGFYDLRLVKNLRR